MDYDEPTKRALSLWARLFSTKQSTFKTDRTLFFDQNNRILKRKISTKRELSWIQSRIKNNY